MEESMEYEMNMSLSKELIASPAELRTDLPRDWIEDAIGHRIGGGVMDENEIPRMPTVTCDNTHRRKLGTSWHIPACVARPVSKKEAAGNQACADARTKEWTRLIGDNVWNFDDIREWRNVAADARKKGKTVHMGRIFGIMVERILSSRWSIER
jgi:hypothetical protein